MINAVQINSKDLSKVNQAIDEVNSEDDVSEKSDTSSDDNDSDSDSSIEAALNGEEESEQSIYNKILAAQEGRDAGMKEETKSKESPVEELVDRNMINLLRVCAMLTRPTPAEIEERKVTLGPPTRNKLLILDMDETLLHSKFHKLDGTED